MKTTTEKLACAKRELGMRRRVYPSRIENNHMTQQKADHEIACMEAIVADYEIAATAEPLPLEPHIYVPSAVHMGDCAICGNLQNSPIHARE